tara:strand:+ start:2160 stop:2360 length:201 start_codon:yes stop_codon:yes gene_type:complete
VVLWVKYKEVILCTAFLDDTADTRSASLASHRISHPLIFDDSLAENGQYGALSFLTLSLAVSQLLT